MNAQKYTGVLFCLLLAISCAPAVAQEPAAQGELAEKQLRVLEKIQVVRAWKLTEVLELDESNGPALMQTLAKYDQQLFAAQRSLRKTERSLRKAMRANASEQELERLLDEAIRKRKEVDRLRFEQLEEAGKTLDVRRRVKLYQFMPKFERQIRKRLRHDKRGPGGHGKRRMKGGGPGLQ